MNDLPLRDRLIFALDVPSADAAKRIIEDVDGTITSYKIGLEMLLTGGASDVIDGLIQAGRRVFLDLKLPGDIDATVERAVAVAAERAGRVERVRLADVDHEERDVVTVVRPELLQPTG